MLCVLCARTWSWTTCCRTSSTVRAGVCVASAWRLRGVCVAARRWHCLCWGAVTWSCAHIGYTRLADLADRVALAMTGWKTIVGPFDRIVLRGDPSGTEEVLPVGHAEAWEVRLRRCRRG